MKKIYQFTGVFMILITLVAGVQAQRGRGQGQASDIERELIRRELQTRISTERQGNVTVRIETADSFYVTNRENEIRGRAMVVVRGSREEQVTYTAVINSQNRRLNSLNYQFDRGIYNQTPDYNRPQSGVVRTGRYQIQLVATNRMLAAGANNTVVQSSARNTSNQQWDIEDAGNGLYYIRSAATGDAMTVRGGLRSGSTIVLSRGQYNVNEQLWQIVAGNDNSFFILAGNNLSLDSPSNARREGGRIQLYGRNEGTNQRFRLTLVSGYNDYYGNRPRNRPGNLPGNIPGQGGSAYGSGQLTWSGRVDNEIHLEIRGNRVTERRLSGQPTYNANYRFSSPLPQTNLNVSVEKRRGGGDVDVIQQPSSSNRYTAVIRIRDRDAGADDYQIEVLWDTGTRQGNHPGQGGGPHGPGQMPWSGRVDDEIHLQIRGNRVTERRLSGQPTYNANYRFSSQMPLTNLNVRVEKRRGRGDVDVIQQPSSSNRYTAVIRIRDRDGGADDYQIEVTWD